MDRYQFTAWGLGAPAINNSSVPLQLYFPFMSIDHFKKILINSGYTGTTLRELQAMVQTNTCLD